MWYVYILECNDGSLYTGATSNLERRFREHQKGTAHYTSYNPPKSIVYAEQFSTKSEALKREAQLKSWTRRKKLALISGDYL
jgi:predicted GIY-YIG superfamily endonuclease